MKMIFSRQYRNEKNLGWLIILITGSRNWEQRIALILPRNRDWKFHTGNMKHKYKHFI